MLWRIIELQKPSILGEAWGREMNQVSESHSNIFANRGNMPTVKLWGLWRKRVKRWNTWIEGRMLFVGIRVTAVLWIELHPYLLPHSPVEALAPGTSECDHICVPIKMGSLDAGSYAQARKMM